MAILQGKQYYTPGIFGKKLQETRRYTVGERIMRTIETQVYKFDELTEEAQEKAIEKLWDINIDYGWDECTLDEFKEALDLIGVYNADISYSGFSSQGDGLSFSGNYKYIKGGKEKMKTEFPWIYEKIESDLIALQKLQKKYFYRINGNIVRTSHYYYHENTVKFSQGFYFDYDIEDELTEIFRSIMQSFYSLLEKNYDYLTSKEAIMETIKVNGYEFTEEGEMV